MFGDFKISAWIFAFKRTDEQTSRNKKRKKKKILKWNVKKKKKREVGKML